MRKLATIQRISEFRKIEGADKIQVALMEGLGWEVVVRVDEFKVGDWVVYIEIDSVTPERPEFEFLRERKFKVKTIKLRKTVSQGLIVPLAVLGNTTIKFESGYDVTEILGIVKNDLQAQQEQALLAEKKHKSAFMKFMMRIPPFRWVYLKLNTKIKGAWPGWISKTDEERIQVCAGMFMRNKDKEWYISEKADGQSMSAFLHKTRKWGMKSWIFGVCSRNLWLKTADNSTYWTVAKKYDLEKKLKALKREIVIQGEILAPKVQGNKYGVSEPDLYVFTVVEDGERVGLTRMREVCSELGLKTVPIIHQSKIIECGDSVQDAVKVLVGMATRKSMLADTEAEGIVLRLCENPNVSFKCISPTFLLKHGE